MKTVTVTLNGRLVEVRVDGKTVLTGAMPYVEGAALKIVTDVLREQGLAA